MKPSANSNKKSTSGKKQKQDVKTSTGVPLDAEIKITDESVLMGPTESQIKATFSGASAIQVRAKQIVEQISTMPAAINNPQYKPLLKEIDNNNEMSRQVLFGFITRDLLVWTKELINTDAKHLVNYTSYINATYFSLMCTAKYPNMRAYYFQNMELYLYFVEGFLKISQDLVQQKNASVNKDEITKKVTQYVSLIPQYKTKIEEFLNPANYKNASSLSDEKDNAFTLKSNTNCERFASIHMMYSRILCYKGDLMGADQQLAHVQEYLPIFKQVLHEDIYAEQCVSLIQAVECVSFFKELNASQENQSNNNTNIVSQAKVEKEESDYIYKQLQETMSFSDNKMPDDVKLAQQYITRLFKSKAEDILTIAATFEASENNPDYADLQKKFKINELDEKSLTTLFIYIGKQLSDWTQRPAKNSAQQLATFARYANATYCTINWLEKYPILQKFKTTHFEIYHYFVEQYLIIAEELFNKNAIKINDNYKTMRLAKTFTGLVQIHIEDSHKLLESITEEMSVCYAPDKKISPKEYRGVQSMRLININNLLVQMFCYVGELEDAKKLHIMSKDLIPVFARSVSTKTLIMMKTGVEITDTFIEKMDELMQKVPHAGLFLQKAEGSYAQIMGGFSIFASHGLNESEFIDMKAYNEVVNELNSLEKSVSHYQCKIDAQEARNLFYKSLDVIKNLKPLARNKDKNSELLGKVELLLTKWKSHFSTNMPDIIQKCLIEFLDTFIKQCVDAKKQCANIIPIPGNITKDDHELIFSLLRKDQNKTQENSNLTINDKTKKQSNKKYNKQAKKQAVQKSPEQVAAEKQKAQEQAQLKNAMRLNAKANKKAASEERVKEREVLRKEEQERAEKERINKERQEALFKAQEKQQQEIAEKEQLEQQRHHKELIIQANIEKERIRNERRLKKEKLQREVLEKEAHKKEMLEEKSIAYTNTNNNITNNNVKKLKSSNIPANEKVLAIEQKTKENPKVDLHEVLKNIMTVLKQNKYQVAIVGEYLLNRLFKKMNSEDNCRVDVVELVSTCPGDMLCEIFSLRAPRQDPHLPNTYIFSSVAFPFEIHLTYSDPLNYNPNGTFIFETLSCASEEGNIDDPLMHVIDNVHKRNGSYLFSALGSEDPSTLFQNHPHKMLQGLKTAQKFNIPLPGIYKKAMYAHASLIPQLEFQNYIKNTMLLFTEGNAKNNLGLLHECKVLGQIFPFLNEEILESLVEEWDDILTHIDSLAPSIRKKFPPVEMFFILLKAVPLELSGCLSFYPDFQLNIKARNHLLNDMRYFHETHDKYGNCTKSHDLYFANEKTHVCMHTPTFTIMYGNAVHNAATNYIQRQPKSKTKKVIEMFSKLGLG